MNGWASFLIKRALPDEKRLQAFAFTIGEQDWVLGGLTTTFVLPSPTQSISPQRAPNGSQRFRLLFSRLVPTQTDRGHLQFASI
jgi:hypothetical protein